MTIPRTGSWATIGMGRATGNAATPQRPMAAPGGRDGAVQLASFAVSAKTEWHVCETAWARGVGSDMIRYVVRIVAFSKVIYRLYHGWAPFWTDFPFCTDSGHVPACRPLTTTHRRTAARDTG